MATSSSDNAVTKTVQEALTLIEDGNKILSKHRNVSDIVLVIGNTGAGKTTISTLLANPDELECYNAGDCNLIYDKSAKISTAEDTTVSKTDVPEIFFHKETNTAIYDLPGFCDTRSASNEIANAFFMKKVADQAKRVKLLFVINHASLLSGGYRNDIKSFLENAMDLIKNPEKFAPGTALVVTKVRGDRYPDEVMTGIVGFLNMARNNLSKTMPDVTKQLAAKAILDAILTKDANNDYCRIAYFSEPKVARQILDLSSVIEERNEICRALHQNSQFCPSLPNDFGLSVSSNAQCLILNISERLMCSIAEIFSKIGQKMETSFTTAVEGTPSVSVGALVKTISNFKDSINLLQKRKDLSRVDFFRSFWEIVSHLKISDDFATETSQLEQIQEHFTFLEGFSGIPFPCRILEWTIPINFAIPYMQKAVQQKISAFQDETEAQFRQLMKDVEKCLQDKLQNCKDNAKEKSKLLQLYASKIVQLNEALSGAKTVNEFIQEVRSSAAALGSHSDASNLAPLVDDIRFKDVFLNLWLWRKCFEDLQGRLREESSLHSMRSQNKEEIESLRQKAEEETNRQNQRMEDMEAEHLKRAKEQEAKSNVEKEEMQNKLNGVKRDFRDQQKKHNAEIDRQQKELESKLQAVLAKNKEEIENVKRDAENKAKEQSKRMEEMKEKHDKHAKKLEEKQKKEKEEMDKKLQLVSDENEKHQRKYEKATEKHKRELDDKLQALEVKNNAEMEKLKHASAVEKKELNQRMEREKEEMVRNAREQEAKLQRENEEIQKTINVVTEDCKNLKIGHKKELEKQRRGLEDSLARIEQNSKEKEEENAKKLKKQGEELIGLMGELKGQEKKHNETMIRLEEDRKRAEADRMQIERDNRQNRTGIIAGIDGIITGAGTLLVGVLRAGRGTDEDKKYIPR